MKLLRYKFSSPNLIRPLTKKYPCKPINYFGPTWIFLTYFLYITQIFSILLPNLGSQKYFLYKPHKLSWALSQTLYPTYYPTWVFTKILITLLPKLGHKIILSSQKDLNSFTLWAKPNKTFLQSPLLHDASKSLLLYDTLKPVATWQYFYKMSKGPILLWHLFTKAQYYFGIYLQKPKYSKNPILFWHLFTKAQYYFGTYL